MTSHRTAMPQPLWMTDARMRRLIADSVRRRRAKRRRELAEFETAVRSAQTAREQSDERS